MIDFNITRWEMMKNADGSPDRLLVAGILSDSNISNETRYEEFSVPSAMLDTLPTTATERAAAVKEYLADQIRDREFYWKQEIVNRPPAPVALSAAGIAVLMGGNTKMSGIKSHTELGTEPRIVGGPGAIAGAAPTEAEIAEALGIKKVEKQENSDKPV